MDLEVVGRHALFFDDDANASFVNSRDALVEWNSLFIDRYDVRHLLSGPLPPITRRRHLNRSSSSPPPHPDAALEFELDQERYLDLPSPSEEPEQDTGNDPEQADAGGYHTVGFSYGNPNEFTEQKINDTERKNNDTEPVFQPAFPVPESLIQNLPPTEKLHQIIARTATFVSKHGGQSEIILRVKQGDNPTFGFLMPDHHLHAYFRFLVDHQELLAYDTDGKSLDEEKKADGGIDQTGGALSLLGSVYGSGEDEDGIIEDAPELGKLKSVEAVNAVSAVSASVPHGSEQIESSGNVAGKNDIVSKSPCIPLKEKVNVIKHNRTVSTVSTVKGGAISGTKKGSDASGSVSTAANKSHAPAMPSTPKVELPILEPPPDQKKVVEKIVEFILKNGREFEAVLIEQNCKHGRFLFLMPSNQYHSYYLTVLQKAQESKLPGKGLVSEKHESVGHVVDKKTAKEGDTASSGSAGHDLPFDYDRKEKFKMVISKLKKDGHDPPSKASEPQSGVSLDTAAAILQAATRGIKNPGLEIFPKSSSGIGQGHSNEGGRDLSSGSLHTSQLQTSVQKEKISGEPHIPVPVAKAIAETAAHAAANEADSSEASLTREQKLKAERLKRAKMFAAMIKSGSAPVKSESLRGLSAEPPESGISSSGNEVVNLSAKEREGSSVPLEADISDKVEEFEKKLSFDECNERRSKRSYRARSKRHEGEEESDNDLEQEAEEEEDKRGHKHSRKKRRSHHSSEHSRDRHKHRRHSSSKDSDSRHHRKHASYDDEKHRHSRRRHKRNTSDDEHQPRKRNRHDSSSDDEHRISRRRYKHSDSSDDEHQHYRRRHKHDNSSEDEHQHHRRSGKHRKPEPEKEADLEEGEIYTKADQSKASEGDHANREASVDFSKSHQIGRAPSQPPQATEVSDDLRAKIRAMLMATL